MLQLCLALFIGKFPAVHFFLAHRPAILQSGYPFVLIFQFSRFYVRRGAGALAQPRPQGGIGGERPDRVGERVGVAGRHEDAVAPVVHDVGEAAGVAGDDVAPAGERRRQDAALRRAQVGQHDALGLLHGGDDVRRRDEAVEDPDLREPPEAGLQPVETTTPLRRIAAQKSRDMVTRRYFSHTAPDRETLMTRLRTIGWDGLAGENIGYGTAYYSTPRAMMWAWMRSQGHRENILEPGYRWVGVAISLGAPTGARTNAATYTTDFGGPS